MKATCYSTIVEILYRKPGVEMAFEIPEEVDAVQFASIVEQLERKPKVLITSQDSESHPRTIKAVWDKK